MADHQQLVTQVRELVKQRGNNVCAECNTEGSVSHTSIVKPSPQIKETIGVFLCSNCYRHHFRMGRKVCETKCITTKNEEWTQVEVAVLSKTGNVYVNSFLEANLEEGSTQNDKDIITFDTQEAAELRCAFVMNKYIEKKYFCQGTYDKVRKERAKSKYSTKKPTTAKPQSPASIVKPAAQEEPEEEPQEEPQKEQPSLRSLMGLQQRSQATRASSTRNLQPSSQRRASIAAPTKKAGTGLDTFLTKTEDPNSKRRCKSVVGTSDTSTQPLLHSDKVYSSTVDVSMDELRALKAAKKAKKNKSRRSSSMSGSANDQKSRRTASTMNSQSETGRSAALQRRLVRHNSPRGVDEELSHSFPVQEEWEEEPDQSERLESVLSSTRSDRRSQRKKNDLDDSEHAVLPDARNLVRRGSNRELMAGDAPDKPERRRRVKKEGGGEPGPERRRRRDPRTEKDRPSGPSGKPTRRVRTTQAA